MRFAVLPALAAFSLSQAQALQPRQSNWTVGQTVQSSSGPVNGHAASNATQVSVYLGIPYAVPPVGDLRFAAPQKYTGNSTINGTSFGFSCPAATIDSGSLTAQAIANANITAAGIAVLGTLDQIGDKFSEDCLTVNVWTKPQTGDSKKAVLVWIYGGSFTTGNSDNPAYDGQFIADQEDVVLVSLNYRLNIFGFPGSPNSTQNLGLLDQRLAVEWVRDNIEAFGGDASRITLFGQSAGGASVDYYTFAWTSDPIASSFIEESGTAIGLGQMTAADGAAAWFNSTSKLGCGDASSDAASVLACMRTKNYTDILSSLTHSGVGGGVGFGPTIDETVVFSDYLNRSAAGNFIQRPLLVGNADNEAGLFKAVVALEGQAATISDQYWTYFNELGFVCPAASRANISIASAVPTWRYRWFGEFPNSIITTVPDSGAWHASELSILFDTSPSGGATPANTPAELAIGSYLRGAWAAFAKDPAKGLTTYTGGANGNGTGWPIYNPQRDTLVRLAFANLTGPNLAPAQAYDGMCNSTLFQGSFAVPAAALSNSTASGTANSTGSASPTASGSSTGSASPSATNKSEGERIGVTIGFIVAGAAIALAL